MVLGVTTAPAAIELPSIPSVPIQQIVISLFFPKCELMAGLREAAS